MGRCEPDTLVSLAGFIRADYAYRYGLDGATADDPAVSCAALIGSAEIIAERDRLMAVEQRCVVSKTAREFLYRVIALQG